MNKRNNFLIKNPSLNITKRIKNVKFKTFWLALNH